MALQGKCIKCKVVVEFPKELPLWKGLLCPFCRTEELKQTTYHNKWPRKQGKPLVRV